MENIDQKWQEILKFFETKFTDGEKPDIDTILFLIGIQELGIIKPNYSRDEKVNLMHIATCKLLEPYGYYEFTHRDDEGWPHYNPIQAIQYETTSNNLIKEAIINYFSDNNLI